ncbi:MAG: CoA-binding protein [Pseudomonadota bacterium]
MVDERPDDALARALEEARTIALVGASPNPARASHQVGLFLRDAGYRVIAVNPLLEGDDLFGEPVRSALSDAAEADFVDVFRRSEALPEIVEEALGLPHIRTIWMQLGIRHAAAATRAREAGRRVIEDRCTKIEFLRLGLKARRAASSAL